MERLSQLAIQTTNSSAAPCSRASFGSIIPAEIKSVSNIVKSNSLTSQSALIPLL